MRTLCGLCGIACHSFSALCTRIGLRHSAGVVITCGIDGCQQTFCAANSLRTHGYRKHAETIKSSQHPHNFDFNIENPSHQACTLPPSKPSLEPEISCVESGSLEDEIEMEVVGTPNLNPPPVTAQLTQTLPQLHQVMSDAITNLYLKIREN